MADLGATGQGAAPSVPRCTVFPALRQQMPMNVRAGGAHCAIHLALEADIARIVAIWETCRREHLRQGPWLFGRWSIADAMLAPVAARFRTLWRVVARAGGRVSGDGPCLDPALLDWAVAAQEEPTLPDSEVGLLGN